MPPLIADNLWRNQERAVRNLQSSLAEGRRWALIQKGFLWLVGRGLVSGITYLTADPGGTNVVFWGALA